MKTIGFVDYYISEWHANNYPVWIKEICESTGRDLGVAYAWAERDISPGDGVSTDEWCKKFGVERCMELSELCEKADFIFILAPSDPEKHLRYAETVFPFGKLTYIDKTFAHDHYAALRIFEEGNKHGTPFFSTSALRYATELDELGDSDNVIMTGGGGNFEEYIIHQIEPAVKLVRSRAVAAYAYDQGGQTVSRVKFENGKCATLVYAAPLPFTVCAEKGGSSCYRQIKSDYFRGLMTDILRFYETGKISFDTTETLEVMRIRDAVVKSRQMGEEIEL